MEESSVGVRLQTCSSKLPHLLGLYVLLLLGGCSANPTALNIVKDVKPLGPMQIAQICIELKAKDENGFANDLFGAVEALGFKTLAKSNR